MEKEEEEPQEITMQKEYLKKVGLSVQSLGLVGLTGDYRPARVSYASLQLQTRIDRELDGLWMEFSLPKGSFATSVLREFMK